MSINNCILSAQIESTLFEPNINSIMNPDEVPNDLCPICLEHLKSKPKCCGGYSRKLKKCSHWVHVYCQIDKNKNRHQCSLCRNEIVDKLWLTKKINRANAINILPHHYQGKFLTDGIIIFNDTIILDDLKNNYHISQETINYIYNVLKDN